MSITIFIQRNFQNNEFTASVKLSMEVTKSINKMTKLCLANCPHRFELDTLN